MRVLNLLFVLTVFFASLSQAFGTEISGTIIVPEGSEFPAGGLSVIVKAENLNSTVPGPSQTITIPYTEPTIPPAAFTLNTTTDPEASWVVSYNITPNTAYTERGFYNSGLEGTQWNPQRATPLSGAEETHTNIHLTLLTLNTIGGTISLPQAPTTDMVVTIIASDGDVPGGTTSVTFSTADPAPYTHPYTLYVPEDAGASWRIEYNYSADPAYLPKGYYSTTGTKWNYNSPDITLLPGGQDHPIDPAAPIDLDLLLGYTISGTIAPLTPDPDSMSVIIYYEDINPPYGTGETIIDIPANDVGSYTLSIPQDDAAAWLVRYELRSSSDTYLQSGYYNNDTGTTEWNRAEAVAIPDTDAATLPEDKDITILVGDTFLTGTVAFPASPVPTGAVIAKIIASSLNNPVGYYAWVEIQPPPATPPSFTIPIPEGGGDPFVATQWQLYYFQNESSDYLQTGYYSTDGTQCGPAQATTLYGDDDGLPALPITLLVPPDPGDINYDGTVDLTDVILSLQIVTGGQPPSPICPAADVNGDTRIGLEEAIYSLGESVISGP